MSTIASNLENAAIGGLTPVADAAAEKLVAKIAPSVSKADVDNAVNAILKLGGDIAAPLLAKGIAWIATKAGIAVN